MKLVNESGELNVPLYHGTSTYFLKGILTNGLAGSNPIGDWEILEFSKELEILCKKNNSENYCYKIAKTSWRSMLDQRADDNLNFQHGDTYLTASFQKAIRYSISNRYGSELLSYTMKISDELRREFRFNQNIEGDAELEQLLRKNKIIYKLSTLHRECSHTTFSPLLIKILHVPVDSLRGEGGGSAEEKLEEIEISLPLFPSDEYDKHVQDATFRLISPIYKDKLEVYLIDVNRVSDIENPDLYPLDISGLAK